jgi:threonyl-tRNA synthetase
MSFFVLFSKLAVGSAEMDTRTVNIRNRDDIGLKGKGEMLGLDSVLEKMLSLKNERRLENKLI